MAGTLPRLVLASASPRRSDLLKLVGVSAQVVPADIDESPLKEEPAASLVARLAAQKAETVLGILGEGEPTLVLGGDTVVLSGGAILGKPRHASEAKMMLRELAGHPHEVVTGVALARSGAETDVAVDITTVWFRELTDADIDAYVATGEPLGKAGAYAIQGLGALFIPRIEGNHSGVVGLPLPAIDSLLTRAGFPLRLFRGTA